MGIIEIAPTRRFTSPFRTVFRPRPTGGINQPNKSATLRNRPIFHQFIEFGRNSAPSPVFIICWPCPCWGRLARPVWVATKGAKG